MADQMEKANGLENYRLLAVNNFEEVLTHKMTYRDYKKIPDDIHCELIDGVIYMMASPDEMHQWISRNLATQLDNQLQGRKCTPYSEFDVRLFCAQDESDVTTVRPDIIVVCDESRVFGKKNCEGPPDVIIEISSESSEKRDFGSKKHEYEKAGVKEYWIVSKGVVHRFLLTGGAYEEHVSHLNESSRVEISTVKDCYLDFQPIIDRYKWL